MSWIKYMAKAIFAGVVTFLGSWISALQAGSVGLIGWLTIALATITAVGGVFGLSNGPSPNEEQRVKMAKRAAEDAGGTFTPAAAQPPVPAGSSA